MRSRTRKRRLWNELEEPVLQIAEFCFMRRNSSVEPHSSKVGLLYIITPLSTPWEATVNKVLGDLFLTVVIRIVVEGTTETHTAVTRRCTCERERERC